MKRSLTALLLLCGISLAPGQVSMKSLLPQMTDLSLLARRPQPYFHTAQASSYDRASKDRNTDWFANGDAGQFLRMETTNGRTEYVLADLKGPGSVVRFWSANPAGTVRFYFDDETTPRLEAKLLDLLSGKVAPFTDPFSYMSAKGANLYFPLPYRKSLKVTVDDTDNNRGRYLYYHIGYRTYEPGTVVQTFDARDLTELGPLMAKVRTSLLDPAVIPDGEPIKVRPKELYTGKTATVLDLKGSKEITELTVDLEPRHEVKAQSLEEWRMLRSILLTVTFDGETCIRAPLGDFFGTVPGYNDDLTVFTEVKGKKLICRFAMPFARRAVFQATNVGAMPVTFHIRPIVRAIKFTPETYHFKAQWGGEIARTRPMRDMTFLKTQGEGRWVGSGLHIANPSDAWWGEGDEKIWVDNDTFPSTFGTGTEDYYGYAWSNIELFQRPYHAQPRCDGVQTRSNRGHSLVQRWHVLDTIPFETSFEFDLEMWHWADVVCGFVHTAYWYAKPGGPGPRPIDSALLRIEPVRGPEGLPGAIEGETMAIVSKTGGDTEIQGFEGLSMGQQIWWKDAKVGDKITFKVPIKRAGRYAVTGNFCHAADYGTHRITLNGQAVEGAPWDFYSSELGWRKRDLGVFDLPAGQALLVVEVVAPNPKAEARNMFGMDYLMLKQQ